MKKLDQKQKVFYILLIAVFLISIWLPNMVRPNVLAEEPDSLQLLNQTGQQANLKSNTDLPTSIGRIVKIILGLSGLILTILLIVGGVMWMISGGQEKQISQAKALMLSAIVGLVIILLSYAIATFVINSLNPPQKIGLGS
ncbi:MAG: pilin [Patescibacteria group bacterium]|nr:pilin [Patescibacteria group bacterium]MDD5164119.1 pilin [Patescibacteria group bacterium]MDD5534223.1 pilin [Patescibacteria group bacterium]